MPGSRSKSRRAPQCSYTEGGRRCRKDGEGNPPLCRAHLIAFSEVMRQQEMTPAQRLADVARNFLSGKPLNQDQVFGAIQDAFWTIGGGVGAGYHPDIDPNGRTDHDQRRGHFDPPAGFPGWPPGNGHGREPPRHRARQRPPQETEEQARAREAHLAEVKARKVMGFATSMRLDEKVISRRRRDLARKHHPDLGGSIEKMKLVNDAADVLLASL